MNKYHLFSLACLIIGIIFFAFGVLSGDVKAGFIVIIPFLAGSGVYALLGFIFVFIAILLFMFSFTSSVKYDNLDTAEEHQPTKKTSIKGGGVVLIGPIPIIFGSNWKITVFLVILAIILIIVSFFILRFY